MATITDFSQLDLSEKYTYADYLTWQLDRWVELIKGKVTRMSPAPKRVHQAISFNLSRILGQQVKGKSCRAYAAPFDVRLATLNVVTNGAIETVVQPDIIVICDLAKLDDQGCIGAPDWIIEILSPGSLARDTKEKFDLYEENGVKEYWRGRPRGRGPGREKYFGVCVGKGTVSSGCRLLSTRFDTRPNTDGLFNRMGYGF